MATSRVRVTEGSGKNLATYSFVEDTETKELQRVVISNSTGVDEAKGAGAVGSDVPRQTLASDDPAVVSLGVMDDWDESDRAKVNLIVGQAGVAAGAGSVGSNTQRITLLS